MVFSSHLRPLLHRPYLWVLALLLFLKPFSHAQTYRLVWEDDFNQFDPTTPSSSPSYNRWDLDRSIWNVEVVDSPFNNEIQQYRDTRDNLRLELDPGKRETGCW